MTIRNALRRFDSYRRDKMGSSEILLYKLLSNNKSLEPKLLDNEDVKHILLIRNNKRIGNMFFMLPFIRELRKQYPDAKIDLLLREPWQGQFFQNMGLGKFDYSSFSFKQIVSWLQCIFRLRKNTYDLVLVPYSSVTDSMMSSMLDARNKVSEYAKDRLPAAPHSSPLPVRHPHAALESLDILKGMRIKLDPEYDHTMAFSQQETENAQQISQQLRKGKEHITLAYFRGARGEKQLDETTWQTVLTQFDEVTGKQINWIEILSPDIPAPLNAETQTYQSKDMRVLAAVLKQMDGFICCDTGPLHLADAAGANCIGLYTHTSIERYGLLGSNTVNVDGLDNLDAAQILKSLKIPF
ncbi:heptosyltransferase [Vibrio sp. vnigr-6D03]|uniref:glycosyltransferase family 9 protein n=1 Tax=Vibrio sp. vnigr-6D03 TaxID=2058088 RepID=UPI000C34C416|nr:glycosyltransferase family 9 protein [Vibrio sp. vnigr-6D03]PKF78300.1 heptosyltransferase [Vibrio sp. vnigr-6D03]